MNLPMSTTSLCGPRVVLRPLRESDGPALVRAASDGALWNLPFTVVPSAKTISAYLRVALAPQVAGSVMPFATVLRASGQVVGCTRLWKIDRTNCKLEIGGTWIARAWQRSFVNTEAKYLMLEHAFEALGCVRVQLTTDEGNAASRSAILRLGARQEGIVRNERIMADGRKRNSVRFSIIDDEWPDVKRALRHRLTLP